MRVYGQPRIWLLLVSYLYRPLCAGFPKPLKPRQEMAGGRSKARYTTHLQLPLQIIGLARRRRRPLVQRRIRHGLDAKQLRRRPGALLHHQ